MGINTVIFDMDDLMVDSHKVHMKVFKKVVGKHNSEADFDAIVTLEKEATFFGSKIQDIFTWLKKWFNIDVSIGQMYKEFNDELLPMFAQGVDKMPGLDHIIKLVNKHNMKKVIASSASAQKIFRIMNTLSLLDEFPDRKSSDGLPGKPDPAIFIAAAQLVSSEFDECVVLEDATKGVAAAKNAGMRCIGVHNIFTRAKTGKKQDLNLADVQVDSLSEITYEMLVG